MYSGAIAVASTLPQSAHAYSSPPVPLNTGRSGFSWTAVPPSGGISSGSASRIAISAISGSYPRVDHVPQIASSFVVKSLIRASSTLWTTPSPIEAALPLIWADVWI